MKLTTKRLLSYLIDMAIIFAIILILNLVIKPNEYNIKLKLLEQDYILNKIDFREYKNEYMKLNYNVDKENIPVNIVACILIIVSFIVVPYFNKGQTIGNKIMKIKIKKKKLTIIDLFVRSLIVNGLGYMLCMFIIIFLISDIEYFILMNFLAFCSILVVIINVFMVLYKEKHVGLADVLTNSRIEEIK